MGSKSKRMLSTTRHKIIRKKRENKRDLRKAAKAMKKSGLKVRSKKSREEAKLALKVSNVNPDKEEILTTLLRSREEKRVLRNNRKLQRQEDALREGAEESEEGEEEETDEEEDLPQAPKGPRSRLLFPPDVSSNFQAQFQYCLTQMFLPESSSELAMPLPTAIVVTVDVRCAVQSLPFGLLDEIIERARLPATKNNDVLLVIAATKCDLVTAQAIGTSLALVSEALRLRYKELPKNLRVTFAPFSTQFEKTARQLMSVLRNFTNSLAAGKSAAVELIKAKRSNMKDKLCVAVVGLPGTGRRSLTRYLAELGNDSGVSVTPARTLQFVHLEDDEEDDEAPKKRKRQEAPSVAVIVPNAKQLTLLSFPEDEELATRAKGVSGGDILFHSFSFIQKLQEPEAVAVMLFQGAIDKVSLCQCFSLPLVEDTEAGATGFLKKFGMVLKRDKGFVFASPMLATSGTAGQITASSLTANTGFAARNTAAKGSMVSAYGGTVPGKVVKVNVARSDIKNSMRMGSRTFLHEWASGKHLPWAVLRPQASDDKKYVAAREAQKSCVFSSDFFPTKALAGAEGKSAFERALQGMSHALNDYLALLPKDIVEFSPDCIAAEQHSFDE